MSCQKLVYGKWKEELAHDGLLSELEGPTSILFTGVSAEQVH